jgi:hypothetical protein
MLNALNNFTGMMLGCQYWGEVVTNCKLKIDNAKLKII